MGKVFFIVIIYRAMMRSQNNGIQAMARWLGYVLYYKYITRDIHKCFRRYVKASN